VGPDSEDDDAVLERMFRMQRKKKLTKEDLPGLYKKRAAKSSPPLPAGDEEHAEKNIRRVERGNPKKRASLPGRLRKKLAQQKLSEAR
jgi:hypothetical protein